MEILLSRFGISVPIKTVSNVSTSTSAITAEMVRRKFSFFNFTKTFVSKNLATGSMIYAKTKPMMTGASTLVTPSKNPEIELMFAKTTKKTITAHRIPAESAASA